MGGGRVKLELGSLADPGLRWSPDLFGIGPSLIPIMKKMEFYLTLLVLSFDCELKIDLLN